MKLFDEWEREYYSTFECTCVMNGWMDGWMSEFNVTIAQLRPKYQTGRDHGIKVNALVSWSWDETTYIIFTLLTLFL